MPDEDRENLMTFFPKSLVALEVRTDSNNKKWPESENPEDIDQFLDQYREEIQKLKYLVKQVFKVHHLKSGDPSLVRDAYLEYDRYQSYLGFLWKDFLASKRNRNKRIIST